MRLPILAALLCTLAAASAGAQDQWNANKGNCQQVLRKGDPKQLDRIGVCTELWEIYRDVSELRPEQKRAVARGFSVLYHLGNGSQKGQASSALQRMGMKALNRDLVLPKQAKAKRKGTRAPVYFDDVSSKRQRQARSLVKKGLKHHKRKKYGKALDLYERAMRADPNYLKAHYNAACAYARMRDAKSAVELLVDIRDRQTRDARRLLIEARRDRDFSPIKRNPKWKAVTGYAEIVLLNGAGAEGTPHVKRLKRQLALANHKPTFVGTDEHARGRPLVWFKPGFEEVAEELRDVVDPEKTALKKITFNTAIDRYDFDVYVVWGMPHRTQLSELPEIKRRRQGGGDDGGPTDPMKAFKEARGNVEDASELAAPPELP